MRKLSRTQRGVRGSVVLPLVLMMAFLFMSFLAVAYVHTMDAVKSARDADASLQEQAAELFSGSD